MRNTVENVKQKLISRYLEKSNRQKQVKSTDINVLLNRVKIEKKDAVKKNLVITVGALGTLALTGLITLF